MIAAISASAIRLNSWRSRLLFQSSKALPALETLSRITMIGSSDDGHDMKFGEASAEAIDAIFFDVSWTISLAGHFRLAHARI